MAISLHTAGTWVAANATTQTVTLPTHSTGDMLIVRVGFKHATMPTTVTCGTAGWAKVATEVNGTGGASSNGGGGVEVVAFWKEATSGAETNPVVTFNGGSVAATPSGAVAMSYQKAADEQWVTPVGDGTPIAAATSISEAIDSHIAATVGDLIDEFHVTNDNTTLTVPTFTQTGCTLDAVTESPAAALSSATSNDISADGCFRKVTAGSSSAAAVIAGTNSVADLGAGWTTRLRVEAIPPPSGTGAISVPAATVSGTGSLGFTATGAVAVPAATVEGAGAEGFTATGAIAVPAATIDGAGDHTEDSGHSATGAISVPAVTVEGTGSLGLTAIGAVTVSAPAVVGSGTHEYILTGTGAIAGPAPTVEGTGTSVGGVAPGGGGGRKGFVVLPPPDDTDDLIASGVF